MPIKAKFHMENQWDGGTKLCSNDPGHMTKMAAMPIYSKSPSKIFFYGTKGPMTLGLGMQHWGLEPNKVCSNDDLGLVLILLTARSNLVGSNDLMLDSKSSSVITGILNCTFSGILLLT